MFVMESLARQVKDLLDMDDEKVAEGLDAHIEEFRKAMEEKFMSGKPAQRKIRLREKPDGWDSDLDGHWTAQPGAVEEVPSSPEPSAGGRGRTKPTSGVTFSDDNNEPFGEEPSIAKAPSKGAATASARVTRKTAPARKAPEPAKKRAAPKKAAARGRKKANPFQDSDDEDEQEDVIMEDDDAEHPARSPPRKSTRETRSRAAPKTRQTTLNFSQSQRAAKPSQKAIEISDDEISEDDAFESMPATRCRRR